MSIKTPHKIPPEQWPNVDHLVTEDDTPVNNLYAEKQLRLLSEPLNSTWRNGPAKGRDFMCLADVGLFHTPEELPLVPDCMLILDVLEPEDIWTKGNRSYFMWKYGKPPDVVVEVVSNDEGDELTLKLTTYAEWGVKYYVVWDPVLKAGDTKLQGFVLKRRKYRLLPELQFPEAGLGLTAWQGKYEEREDEWLRWCDENGIVIATGHERAEQQHQRADSAEEREEKALERAKQADERAKEAAERAAKAAERAEKLAAQLRTLGIDAPKNGT